MGKWSGSGGGFDSVTGTVTYRERTALPSDALVVVRLEDVSRADAPAVLIAEQVIEVHGRQVPFAFELRYDPAAIDARFDYNVRARIERSGKLLFTSTRRYPVITRDRPRSGVEIIVVPVGGARPATR